MAKAAVISSVCPEATGIFIIAKVFFENAADAIPNLRIQNREDAFDTAVKIAGHPVGATGKDVRFIAVVILEIKDATVFEVASQDASHADVVTEAFDIGDEATNAPDDKVDLNAGAGGAIEIIYRGWVDEAIGLNDDTRRFSGTGVASLGLDVALDGRFEVKGGNE